MNKYEQSRRFADKSTKVARETIECDVGSAEEATNGARLSFLSSFTGMRELNAKLIDMAHANANAVFDLAHEIASAQAPSDLVTIWSTYASRKFEMMTKQAEELTELGQKLASSGTEPLSRSVSEVFRHRT
ncbi:MAG: phasin family protein [Xanthobacteraceae bacterium]